MKPQLERVKQLVMKQLTGQLTAAEERELERLVQTDSRCRRLAGRLLSPEFLSKAVLDHNNKQAQAASWQSLYERMGYTGGVLGRFRRIRRWMVAAAAVLFLLLGWQVWRYQERDAAKVIYPGITQAEICWPDGQQFTYTSDMLNGKFSLASDTEAKDTVSQGFVSPDLYTRVVVPLGSEYRIGLDDGTQITSARSGRKSACLWASRLRSTPTGVSIRAWPMSMRRRLGIRGASSLTTGRWKRLCMSLDAGMTCKLHSAVTKRGRCASRLTSTVTGHSINFLT